MKLSNSTRRLCRKVGKDCGSVVILTLWSVVFLSLLATAIASQVAAHLQVVSDLKWGTRSRSIGMRALADALDVLKSDQTTSYDSLHELWANNTSRFQDIAFGEGTFSVVRDEINSGLADSKYGLTDEEGKINLNRAPASVLSLLFQEGGMTLEQAEELALFVVDWRDVDTIPTGSNAGNEACATEAIPYLCKNGDFEAIEELWWMPGMTTTLFDNIRQELTLYGGGTVNANTATAMALRCLGLSSAGADILIQWRSSAGNFFDTPSAIIAKAAETGMSEEDQEKLGVSVAQGLFGTRSDVYRGEVEANFGGRARKVASFIVNRNGKVLWWRE